jgi:hypothetical protein
LRFKDILNFFKVALEYLASGLCSKIEIIEWLYNLSLSTSSDGFNFNRGFVIIEAWDSCDILVQSASMLASTFSVNVVLLSAHSVLNSIFTILVVLLLGALLVFDCHSLSLTLSNFGKNLIRLCNSITFEGLLLQLCSAHFSVLFLQRLFHLVQNESDDISLVHATFSFSLDVKLQ